MIGGESDTTANLPKIRDDLIFRQLDEEWVVYDSEGAQLHVLNKTAALVWLHCTDEHSVSEIANAVADVFDLDITRETLEQDIRKTIAEFAQKGLLA